VHVSREVPCTAFGEVSIKPSAGELRNAESAAASQHPVGLKAPVKLIVSLRTDNDEVRGSGWRTGGATAPDRKAISQLPPAHYLFVGRIRSLDRKCWARLAW
jgi:hypothetical protein